MHLLFSHDQRQIHIKALIISYDRYFVKNTLDIFIEAANGGVL